MAPKSIHESHKVYSAIKTFSSVGTTEATGLAGLGLATTDLVGLGTATGLAGTGPATEVGDPASTAGSATGGKSGTEGSFIGATTTSLAFFDFKYFEGFVCRPQVPSKVPQGETEERATPESRCPRSLATIFVEPTLVDGRCLCWSGIW